MANEAELRRRKRIDRKLKAETEGVYAIASWKGIFYLTGPKLVLIVGLLVLPLITFSDLYWQRVVMLAATYAILSISFDFLMNFVGLVCLGGSLFVGVGGYISAILNSWCGLSTALSIPIATITGAAFCTLILLPVLRLQGVYFAIATLIYPILVTRIIEATAVFGGTEGIFGIDLLPNKWFEIYIAITMMLIFLFILRRLVNQDIGMVLRGIKDNEKSIEASGMNLTYYKVQAVFIASILGCFVGAYLPHIYQWAGMPLFAVELSIIPITAAVIGGMGTLAGPVLGCFIIVPISELLRGLGSMRMIFHAVVIIFMVTFWREGLLNWLRRRYEQFYYWEEL